MIYALKSLRDPDGHFETGRYATEEVEPWAQTIGRILQIRQTDASAQWKELGEKITGQPIPDFDIEKYQKEYMDAPDKKHYTTFLGEFILAALAQKSMVTNRIFRSGSKLAGYSVDYGKRGFRGMKDFKRLAKQAEEKKGE
jgi:hypothetical protein